MSSKVMKLVNRHTSEMECRVCGATHFASTKPNSGGRFYRGSWQCQNGCRPEKQRAARAVPIN